jgi:DNA-binding LytR/AlgR family response regulator
MFKCIIVDDQRVNIEVIEEHLKKMPQLVLINTFTNPVSALNFLQENDVDLAFLDVQMPDLDGLEIIEALRIKKRHNFPLFILITGHSKYALSGFEYGVVDFLLKPISFKRFNIAIDRFIEKQSKTTQISDTGIDKDYFFIESEGSKLKLNYKDIAYVESQRNFVEIVGKHGKKPIYKPMHYIENILTNQHGFLRVHKSFIISINYIEVLRVNDIILNVEGQKKTISIGGTYKENVFKTLNI